MARTQAVRSPRVLAFVQEYVWGEHAGNGAQSVLAAGLCQKNHPQARRYAYQLLRKPAVKALVDKESTAKETLLKGQAALVAERTLRVAMTEPDGECVSTADTIRAQELFLKYAGKLKDKLEIGDPNGDPIKIVFNLSPPKP